MSNGHRSPEEIRADMERTRAEMSETVDAIQEKLSPQHIKQQVQDAATEKAQELKYKAQDTVKGVSSDVFETIKQNPIPSALVAIGLGWLFSERKSSRDQDRYYRSQRDYRIERGYGYAPRVGVYEYEAGMPMEARPYGYREESRLRQATGTVQDRAEDVKERVAGTAEDVKERVAGTAEDVRERVSDVAEGARDRIGDIADEASSRAQRTAYRAKTGFQQMMDDQPLLVGAAALALGAVIGLSLPSTRKEDELMGDARDRLVEQAKDKAQETAEKAQHIAQEAVQTAEDMAKEETHKQNITG